MVRFSLRHLEYACAVDRHGGIAQAARHLNISQPAVAQGLDKLEAATGLKLFDRHHARGVTVTPQGRQFLGSARALLAHAARVERDAAAIAAHEAGEIRLGCFTNIAAFYLPGIIRTFHAAHPGIRIHAQEMTLDLLPARVRDASIDMCLTYDAPDDLNGLDVTPLVQLQPVVVLPAGHRCAGRKSVRLQDLADEPYVMYDAPGSREYFDALLSAEGFVPDIAYASQSLEGVRTAVGAGFGFTILALHPHHPGTYDGGTVATVPVAASTGPLSLVAAMRPAARDNRLAAIFLDHLVRQCAGHRPGRRP